MTSPSPTRLLVVPSRFTSTSGLAFSSPSNESAICIELADAGLTFARQVGIPLYYEGTLISEHRPDLIVASRVVVEIKSVERLDPIHTAQLLTYLRVTGLKTGLVVNFNSALLKHGVRRVLL